MKQTKKLSSSLIEAIKETGATNKIVEANNNTQTENGALTYRSSLDKNVDLFSVGAAARKLPSEKLISLFSEAMAEDSGIASKILFYLRDIRGGQGEREVFRKLLNYSMLHYPNLVIKNLKHIPEYGRWDDLIALLDSDPIRFDNIHKEIYKIIKTQIKKDLSNLKRNEQVSLLAKWLPSENASSKKTKRLAKIVSFNIGLDSRTYRKTLTLLRSHLKIVEKFLCKKEYGNIEYSSVPSRASLIYKDAFKRHDEKRYSIFLSNVEKGKEKINAATLYPYDIYKKAINSSEDRTLEVLWESLPNYLEDNPHNGIVVADVSGSMDEYGGDPMAVSVSLALYFAERNKGIFKDYFITFSDNPVLQKVYGNSLKEKLLNIKTTQWSMTTNLQAVFDLILNNGKRNNVPQSDMPDVIYIISDMQFNCACPSNDNTALQTIRQKYEKFGYKMPKIVFWNVRAAEERQSPALAKDTDVVLVSGCSPVVFKNALGNGITPKDFMLQTILTPRYEKIKK